MISIVSNCEMCTSKTGEMCLNAVSVFSAIKSFFGLLRNHKMFSALSIFFFRVRFCLYLFVFFFCQFCVLRARALSWPLLINQTKPEAKLFIHKNRAIEATVRMLMYHSIYQHLQHLPAAFTETLDMNGKCNTEVRSSSSNNSGCVLKQWER